VAKKARLGLYLEDDEVKRQIKVAAAKPVGGSVVEKVRARVRKKRQK